MSTIIAGAIKTRFFGLVLPSRFALLAFAFILTLVADTLIVKAQSNNFLANNFLAEHQQAYQHNPAGANLNLKLKDNKTRFHSGEIIELELNFSASKQNYYSFDNASYDRSGRLDIDAFCLDPIDGVADPLHDYYHSDLFMFMFGGLRGIGTLSEKPVIINADLNEWHRFDKPGKYRLYVLSHRIGKRQRDQAAPDNRLAPLCSNIVEFEIVPPDQQWSANALRTAIQQLDLPGKDQNDQTRAARVLRFLNSDAAAAELAKRFTNDDRSFDYEFGLLGHPDRALVVREMEKQLSAPDHPISRNFLTTLSFLSFMLQHPERLPDYQPGNDEQYRKLLNERKNLYQAITNHYLDLLVETVASKRNQARAVSLNTILEFSVNSQNDELSTRLTKISQDLATVFFDLPIAQQRTLIEYHWRQFSPEAVLPILRRLYDQPDSGDRSIADMALQRIYQLSPTEGRKLILAEIESRTPRVDASVLAILPDKTLPDLDNSLAENLAQSERSENGSGKFAVHCQLVARYATGAVLNRIQAVYAEKSWPCAELSALLAYFWRVEPELATEYFQKALHTRKQTGCYRSLFTDVAKHYCAAEMATIAIKALDDEEFEVAIDAANFLAHQGGPETETFIWQRLEKLYQQWPGDKPEASLDYHYPENSVARLEAALVSALGKAQGWTLDNSKIEKLKSLCHSESDRREANNFVLPSRIEIVQIDAELNRFLLAHFTINSLAALKEKLNQLPTETVIVWPYYHNGTREQKFAEIRSIVEAVGLKMEKE